MMSDYQLVNGLIQTGTDLDIFPLGERFYDGRHFYLPCFFADMLQRCVPQPQFFQHGFLKGTGEAHMPGSFVRQHLIIFGFQSL